MRHDAVRVITLKVSTRWCDISRMKCNKDALFVKLGNADMPE